jgi:hypothetical protein
MDMEKSHQKSAPGKGENLGVLVGKVLEAHPEGAVVCGDKIHRFLHLGGPQWRVVGPVPTPLKAERHHRKFQKKKVAFPIRSEKWPRPLNFGFQNRNNRLFIFIFIFSFIFYFFKIKKGGKGGGVTFPKGS